MALSLAQLIGLMKARGAIRLYAKRLAPNDNSKNQIYLGGDFSALNIIPHESVYTDADEVAGSKRDRAKAKINFYWVDDDGRYVAPYAGLILYPKYPEVRMSGFLKGCAKAPSKIMTSRGEGRTLIMGMTGAGDVLGYALEADDPISVELSSYALTPSGLFLEIPADGDFSLNAKASLLRELKRIYALNWIASQKLAGGVYTPYAARNGGGYTLEAMLGIPANSKAEPDYMGWEVKQYGVADFVNFAPKSPITLITPEPQYTENSATDFVHKFGYPDKSGKPDRINFGGIYANGKAPHRDTGLQISLEGYDPEAEKITDIDGGVLLSNSVGEVAARWSFPALLDHWNRKHAKAAYVPSLFQTPPPEYAYGPKVLLCEQTDFMLFLKAFASGTVYYDPALKLEDASNPKSSAKPRSQFRVRHRDITQMYHSHEIVDLAL